MMLAIVLIAVTILAVIAVAGLRYRLQHTPDNGDLESSLDAEIRKRLRFHPDPALVVAVRKAGRTIVRGVGSIGPQDASTPSGDTVFQIGSITKVFTASLLQLLCDEGRLSMDSTLGELLGSQLPLSPRVAPVTLRQLATHTSGFPRVPKPLLQRVIAITGRKGLMVDPYSHLQVSDVLDYLRTAEGMRSPGRFRYSNFGMGLLGHVMERVTNTPFEQVLRDRIFSPLQMGDTAVTPEDSLKMRMAQGFTAGGEPTPPWTMGALAGAGAISSTANDMMRFVDAIVEAGPVPGARLRSVFESPRAGNPGLGWIPPTIVDRFLGNRDIAWHDGMTGGFSSYLSIDASTGNSVLILSAKAVDATMMGMMLTRLVRIHSWAQAR